MPELPLADFALVRRIDHVANAFTERWLESVPEVTIERFGAVVAPVAAELAEVDFMNRAMGLTPESVAQLDELLAFYRVRDVRPWFELSPHPHFEELAQALSRAGCAQIGFHAAMYGLPVPVGTPPAAGVDIRNAFRDDVHVFGQVYAEGHEVPAAHREAAASNVHGWADVPGWRLYVATVDGEPAGVAALALDAEPGVAYLSNAATVPARRGRGVQTALLRRRMADALEGGCELVVSLCAFGSVSQHNMERCGLRLAYLKAVWRMA